MKSPIISKGCNGPHTQLWWLSAEVTWQNPVLSQEPASQASALPFRGRPAHSRLPSPASLICSHRHRACPELGGVFPSLWYTPQTRNLQLASRTHLNGKVLHLSPCAHEFLKRALCQTHLYVLTV